MRPPVTALLGPTNTGKTHLALERMLEHRTGMIGFPLRLLARENYDKVVKARGPEAVALVTGEEHIVPATATYFICTVEAMPTERKVDFLAIDEVQLAADRERGHVFTDRILHARGRDETMLLGAETMRPLLKSLVPHAGFLSRPRFSTLSYREPIKLGRMPRRTAIIAFSLTELYALAERLRREAGGVAVVFGALSPRTRNAQVGLYQAGDVDYLVATDAIGMGLNLDIDHVVFTSLTKFDGRGPRTLRPAEVGQIAGRAGRYMKDGTFGATTDLGPLEDRLVHAIEGHHFEPLESIYWRNADLSFDSVDALLDSLEQRAPDARLVRMTEADDHEALRALLRDEAVCARLRRPEDVRLLWDVCQVPDFRNVMTDAHTRLLARLHGYLADGRGLLPDDFVAAQVAAIDRMDGDIDTLLLRIASIRTWTFISNRGSWLADAGHWQQRTRAVEDRLSDVLHDRLTEQFVDRRATFISRHDGEVLAEVTDTGEVLIQGIGAGRVEGFVFVPHADLRDRARPLLAAANKALREGAAERVQALLDDPDDALHLADDGQIHWRGGAIARLASSDNVLAPRVEPLASELLDPPLREKVRRRVAAWVDAMLHRRLAPLYRAREAEASAVVRGIVFVASGALGVVNRREIAAQVGALQPADRQELARLGVSVGRLAIWMPAVVKSDTVRLRAQLWILRHGAPAGDPRLPDGRPSVPWDDAVPAALWAACGYLRLGPRAVRVDRLEHLAATLNRLAHQGPVQPSRELAGIVGVPVPELAPLAGALGFVVTPAGAFARAARTPARKRA
jgi:ATP-dependent RNA helicase SUPV3L1/SUV3